MNRVSTDDLRAMFTDPDPDVRWKARMLVLRADNQHEGGVSTAQEELGAMRADPDPAVRRRAEDLRGTGLRGNLLDHLQVMVEVLADDTAAHAWPGCGDALRVVAPGMWFEFLVRTLGRTTSESLRGRLADALDLPSARVLRRFTTEEAGENASVTCRACTRDAAGTDGDDPHAVPTARCARVSALVALLASRDERIRRRAVGELATLGPGVAGVLRSSCRPRTPSRRGALAALAGIDWREMDPADRELLTRFIRTRQPAETPAPLGLMAATEWYAIPTTDQAAVLDAFDLCDPVPATIRMGLAPWNGMAGGEEFEQVYVSPALDGWTLVFANYPTLDGGGSGYDRRARAADALHRCWRLSDRFGAAHWYAQQIDGYTDHSGWCVYEQGEPVRYCYYHPVWFDLPAGSVLVGPTSLGDLDAATPAQDLRTWLAERDTSTGRPLPSPPRPEARAEADEDGDGDGPPDDWEFSVSRVAGRLSVNPESFGPDTRVVGTGVLAVPRALRDRPRRGTLPV